uniref:Monovalent cation/H+ antiporter subunit B n=1 Tax=uncultured organism TaxID=155900 RepID=M1PV52_9ZZZZ|nr:monovalent cation/H+ antiporter subunit B [uncultured organism]
MNWEMSRVVKTVTNVLVVPIAVFGIYLIIHGHLTPGGGFQGGAVVASSMALLIVAYGSLGHHKDDLSSLESTGLTLFILLAFIGIGFTVFYNYMAGSGVLFNERVPDAVANAGNINTGGTVTLMNIAVGMEVSAALSLILWMMGKRTGSMEAKK